MANMMSHLHIFPFRPTPHELLQGIALLRTANLFKKTRFRRHVAQTYAKMALTGTHACISHLGSF